MKKVLLFYAVLLITGARAQVSDFNAIDFSKADSIAELHNGENLNNLSLLAHKLTSNLSTDAEKFRAIYTWVSTNIKSSGNIERIVNKNRDLFKDDSLSFIKWNLQYQKKVFHILKTRKKTVCTGYAYLVKELASLADIECEIINGYGRTALSNSEKLEFGNHSWNGVKLNGKWYLCDPTWSAGYYDGNTIYISDYNDGYFLSDPVLFAKNHIPFEKKWLLDSTLVNKPFMASALIYNETFKYKLVPVTPDKMKVTVPKGHEMTFSFRLLDDKKLNSIELVSFSPRNENKLSIYDLKTEGLYTSFKKSFRRKGSFDVHLKVNNDVVATYVIKVE